MTTETLSVLHGPREPYPGGARIEELVARTAERCGDAVALRWRETEVTYAELMAERRFRGLGAGRGRDRAG